MLAAINIWWAPIDFALKLIVGVIVFFFIIIGIEVLKDQAREAERRADIEKHRKTDPFYGMYDDDVVKLAEKGNTNAMYEYYLRNHRTSSFVAFDWLVSAAEAGHPRACLVAAQDYLEGYIYDSEDHCLFYFDEHPGFLLGTHDGKPPSRETLRSWLECAANNGIKVEQRYWNKLNRYNR